MSIPSGEQKSIIIDNSLVMPIDSNQQQPKLTQQDGELDLRRLFAAIDDVMVVVDRDGTNLKIISTNASGLAYTPEEIADKSLSDLFSASQVELFLNCNHQALVTGEMQICEYSLLIDNTEHWFQGKCSALTAETVLCVVRDITERKLAESQLAEQNILHEQTTLALQESESRWQFAITELEQLNQGLEDKVTARTAELQSSQTKFRQQAERETLLRVITHRVRQSLDINTIFDTACVEIREVLQADRVGIFQFYPDSDFDDGEFVAESVAAEFPSAMSIRIHDHCFGNNYSDLYAKGRFYVADDIYQNGLTSCHTDILAQFAIRANLVMPLTCGDRLWGLLCIHQCSATRNWQQSEIDFSLQISNQIVIAIQQTDLVKKLQIELSERQQAQQLLIERNEELSRATRLKDEFLANMSHELRTPLNAILGLTEGLQEEVFGSVNSTQMKHLQTIERSGAHLLELINDILDVAKIESGQLELDCNFTDITMLCSSSMAFIKQQALKKRIQIETKISNNLPELSVDERRIRQVLINLLNNAVKFTPEGGHITLQVSHHQEPIVDSFQLQGITRINIYPTQADLKSDLDRQKEQMKVREYLKIAIIDTGIGIAPEHIHKLFQPFIQIDSALNRQYEGTGLGLSLVKRIVELHGGQVRLTSKIGQGSCFSIELPCMATDRSSPELAALSNSSPEQSNFSQQPQAVSGLILLAEDNEANISTISSYLEIKGYRLVVAKNGQEAINLAQSAQPDLILMDIQMPGMDGLEAMQQIRLNPNLVSVPIIALTALAMTEDRERCLSAGANEYISKPIKLRQLTATIQRLLSV